MVRVVVVSEIFWSLYAGDGMKVTVEYDFPEITTDSDPKEKEIAVHNLKFDIESRIPSVLFSKYNYTWKIGEPEYNS